jgi:hypothetical protein
MTWHRVRDKAPVCLECEGRKFLRWCRRAEREKLVPIAGWAWDTDDGWHASQCRPKPAVVKSVPCQIMVARKHVGMDGTD